MKIKKHDNGLYYAHVAGSRPINLKVRNAEDAKRVASAARLAEIEQAHLAKSLSRELISRYTSTGNNTGRDALARWEEHVALVGRAKTTVHRYRTAIGQFLRQFNLMDQSLFEVTDSHVMEFVNPDSAIKRTSRLLRLNALQSFFAVCARHGLTSGNPAELAEVRMDQLNYSQKEATKREPFSQVQIDMMTVRLPGEFWRPAVILANEYGLRIGDVASLEWAQFDIPHRRLIVWTDKHDKRIELTLTPAVVAAVSAIPRGESPYLFPRERDIVNNPATRAMLSTYFTREIKRLGIEGRSFHCLRHTFATRHRALGMSVDDIREKLGHSSPETTQGYIHT